MIMVTCGTVHSAMRHPMQRMAAHGALRAWYALGTRRCAQSADIERGERLVASAVLLSPTTEAEAAWSGNRHGVARLRACAWSSSKPKASLSAGAYAITGGLGGLELRAAKMLIESGASGGELSSRSGRVGRLALARRRVQGLAWQCDVGDAADGIALLAFAPTGVLHVAGVLHDKRRHSMASNDVHAVFAPKAVAASHLQTLVMRIPRQAFGLFSSVA